MRYSLCCLVLALPALGQSGEITPVALFTQFQQPPPKAVFDSIQHEVASIMAPLGFPFEWKSLNGPEAHDVATELAVITFRGNCGIASLFAAKSAPGPLGITHLTDGVVLPFAEVDCDRVRGFLRNKLNEVWPDRREATFGRAVGRVLAHELFHIFVGTTNHGSSGVAEAFFTQNELMSDRFQFNTSEFRILRASLKQARMQNGLLRSKASPVSGRSIFGESGCGSCHGSSGEGTQSAPSLHAIGKLLDAKTAASKLAKDVMRMFGQSKVARLKVPRPDDDEIADVVSFLTSLE